MQECGRSMSSLVMRTTYEEVKYKKRVKTFCQKCKKKLVRVVSACQTINPWNRHADRRPKTKDYDEIRDAVMLEVREKATGLEQHGTICQGCE